MTTWETLLARLSRRISLLENLNGLEQDVSLASLYKETVKNTLPLLSECFQLLEQAHILDITEMDGDNQIDDILQHRIEQLQECNQKWKQWEELANVTQKSDGRI
ncbi:hypothetical protein GpartN1_g7014.t1 [Galdieria partita]|uniref:Uncharacterized protein n=1 Tax=Galdieria partita TaxID=83374 RepID=A0A9C7Q2D1_9RHOD|nr:hypothetical protein GpartN1_g6482.t1 [Galdieria partita]GJQ15223.1 hypothetical protein GpartN1_g7014.t1 [Galdieria partita]